MTVLRRLGVVFVAMCSLVIVSTARADFLFQEQNSAPSLLRDDGSIVTYGEGIEFPEIEIVDTGTLSGDGTRVLVFGNTLGTITIFSYDLYSGGDFIDRVSTSEAVGFSLRWATRPNDPFGHGDLFMARDYYPGVSGAADSITMIDSTTGNVIDQIAAPDHTIIRDFDLGDGISGPDTRLYFSADNNIYAYDEYSSGFVADSSNPLITLPEAIAGDFSVPLRFAAGPDGNLYVLHDETDTKIDRYNATTGAFVDTFVSNVELDPVYIHNVSDLTFGPSGDLYVRTANADSPFQTLISRFDISTGQLLANYPVSIGSGSHGFIVVSDPVPEPGSLALLSIGGAILVWRRPRRGS